MFTAGLDNLREQQRGRWSDRDLGVADKPRLPMWDQGLWKKLQVGIIGERDDMCLCCIVGIHSMDLCCRLCGNVGFRAWTKRDVQRKAIALQQASGGGDQEHTGEAWHF